MNYLAHLVLSFNDEQRIGQLLNDFIPNRDRQLYPPEVQKGIAMHREIDRFTDAHPVTKQAREVFRPVVGRYCGAFLDVAMDHFLAKSLLLPELQHHSDAFVQAVRTASFPLPQNFLEFVEQVARYNFLVGFREAENMEKPLRNLLMKCTYLPKDLPVYETFLENREALEKAFQEFYPELEKWVEVYTAEGNYKTENSLIINS